MRVLGVDREAVPFAAILCAATALLGAWSLFLGFACLALLLFTIWFFRDPERTPPASDGALLSPADGRVLTAGPERVSIFMNVFDVHVCRAPMAGRVVAVSHHPGRFLSAFRDAASEQNERVVVDLERDGERLRFTLVAGLIARRVVCRVAPGAEVAAGERVGLIRFGSRVDVDLPPGCRATIRIGARVRAGESVIALRDRAPRA